MIKSVIFDLDGTIIDSMPVWYDVDRIFLSENGIEAPDDISDIVKKMTIEESSMYFIKRFQLRHSQEYVIKRIQDIVAFQYENVIPLKPYVNELVSFLEKSNIPFCIATSTYTELAVSALKRLGIYERFRFVLTCSEVGKGKTSPLIYFRAAELLGTSAAETAVFEDSLHCIETAGNAGFFTAAVYDDSSADDWQKITEKSCIALKNLSEAVIIFKQE